MGDHWGSKAASDLLNERTSGISRRREKKAREDLDSRAGSVQMS